MAKVFGILALVVGLWISMEVVNKGVDHAFGGIFASEKMAAQNGNGDAKGSRRSVPRRAGDKVDAAHAEAAQRRERLLGD